MELNLDLVREILVRMKKEEIKACLGDPVFGAILEKPSFQHLRALRQCREVVKNDQVLLITGEEDKPWCPSEREPLWKFLYFDSLDLRTSQKATTRLGSTTRLTEEDKLSYSNGLVCTGCSRDCLLYNPSNRVIVSLPRFSQMVDTRTFIGFCPNASRFKILGMSRPKIGEPFELYKVLTLETKDQHWRDIACEIPHVPATRSVCISSVVFYAATLSQEGLYMIGFNLDTESFTCNHIPQTSSTPFMYETAPFNLNGKVAISILDQGSIHQVWSLENTTSDTWSLLSFETPSRSTWGQDRDLRHRESWFT